MEFLHIIYDDDNELVETSNKQFFVFGVTIIVYFFKILSGSHNL